MYVFLKFYVKLKFQFIAIGPFLMLAVRTLLSLIFIVLLSITLLVAITLPQLCFWSPDIYIYIRTARCLETHHDSAAMIIIIKIRAIINYA